jgi:hypothetical protein
MGVFSKRLKPKTPGPDQISDVLNTNARVGQHQLLDQHQNGIIVRQNPEQPASGVTLGISNDTVAD